MRNPDVSVFNIKLTDSESAIRQVGSGAPLVESNDDLPHARFVSKDGAEELILYAHYAAGPDEYAEAEVRPAGTEALALEALPTERFLTGRGIALGMSPAEVIARFGTCTKSRTRNGASETIEYVVEKADSEPDLKEFGYETYYAEYEFEKGRLVRYRFGFESP
jgi:hypothetical protein